MLKSQNLDGIAYLNDKHVSCRVHIGFLCYMYVAFVGFPLTFNGAFVGFPLTFDGVD